MKLLATVKWADAIGGAERSVLDVTAGLVARGNDVTVMYFHGEELLPEYRRRGCSVVRGLEYFLDHKRRAASAPRLLRSAVRGIRTSPELVYIQDWEHAPLGALMTSMRRVPLVSHLRMTPPLRWARQNRLALPRVDRFIAVSNDVRERFVESGLRRDRIDVVHNGLDTDRFSPGTAGERATARAELGIEPDEFVVMYAGRLDKVKGVETLIAACNRRAELGRPVHLLAAGQPQWHADANARSDYLTHLRRIAGPTKTQFLGVRLDLLPIYRAADLVVVPSIWTEPFGRVVIEGMACGRPVIASRVGGIPEILCGDLAHLLVEPGDVDDLVQRMNEVEAAAESIGARCREEVEARFRMQTTLDGIQASLESAGATFTIP